MGYGRTYHKCAMRRLDTESTLFAGDPVHEMWITWCGKSSLTSPSDRADLRKSRREATCLKCSAAIGKAGLARYGDRVKLTRCDPESNAGKRYRSAWIMAIDGVERALILSERGFGKGWETALLPDGKDEWRAQGPTVSGDKRPRWRTLGDADPWPDVAYASRDAMAVSAMAAFERGELPTVAERAEAEERRKEERAQAEAEAEKRRSERIADNLRRGKEKLERVETARAAIAELQARADLTNLEASGLVAMLALLDSE